MQRFNRKYTHLFEQLRDGPNHVVKAACGRSVPIEDTVGMLSQVSCRDCKALRVHPTGQFTYASKVYDHKGAERRAHQHRVVRTGDHLIREVAHMRPIEALRIARGRMRAAQEDGQDHDLAFWREVVGALEQRIDGDVSRWKVLMTSTPTARKIPHV